MNLYRKLLLAQSPLALALAIVGVVSVVVISFLGSHSQTILKDNYRSVLAAQRMKEAIERMDSAALFIVAGERQKGIEQAEKYRPIFETELKVQEGNITEAGEKEFTEGLRKAWMDYQAKFDRLQKTTTPDEARRLYFSELEAAFYKVKASGGRDPGDQPGRDGAQERRGASNRGTHEYHYAYRGSDRIGVGSFRFDPVDAPHVTAVIGAQRGDPQNRRR